MAQKYTWFANFGYLHSSHQFSLYYRMKKITTSPPRVASITNAQLEFTAMSYRNIISTESKRTRGEGSGSNKAPQTQQPQLESKTRTQTLEKTP